jgi:serine/threonine protein kinase
MSARLPDGFFLQDKYRITGFLGDGSFGITYVAFDTMLNREVAIKELFPRGSEREGSTVKPAATITDFDYYKDIVKREGAALAAIDHPNVVRIYEAFESNGTTYLVMERLRGNNMREQLGPDDGPLVPMVWVKVLDVVRQIADGLEAIHSRNLLHRDIKPANIFLTEDGVAKLIDFGAVRVLDGLSGTAIFTPGFAPPEQVTTVGELGPQTDIYALAVTAYFAATAVMPSSYEDRLAGFALVSPHVVNPDVPPTVEPVFAQALDERRLKRQSTAQAFSQALQLATASPAATETVIVRDPTDSSTGYEDNPGSHRGNRSGNDPSNGDVAKGSGTTGSTGLGAQQSKRAPLLIGGVLALSAVGVIGWSLRSPGTSTKAPSNSGSDTSVAVSSVPSPTTVQGGGVSIAAPSSPTEAGPVTVARLDAPLPKPRITLGPAKAITAEKLNGQNPRISDDGSSLAFTAYVPPAKFPAGKQPEDYSEVYLAVVKDPANPLRMTDNDTPDIDAVISHDHAFVAYWSRSPGSVITVVNTATGVGETIGESREQNQFPSFLSDGRIVYLAANGEALSLKVWDPKSKTASPFLTPTQSAPLQNTLASFDVSTDNFLLVTEVAGPTDTKLWIVDLNDPNAPAKPITDGGQRDEAARFVPATGLVIFSSTRANNQHRLYVMGRDGSNVTPLSGEGSGDASGGGVEAFSPSVTADGHTVFFTRRLGPNLPLRIVSAELVWHDR